MDLFDKCMILTLIDNLNIGRLHPLLVHLPIGFYVLFIFLFLYRGYLILLKLTDIILFIAALVSTLTAITGYVLAPFKGYDTEILKYHQWLGISTAIIGWIIWWINRNSENKIVKNIFIFILALLIIITGHLGGNLTHGKNYVFASSNTKVKATIPTSIDSVNLYTHIVKPILYEYCLSCHHPTKLSGGWNISKDSSLFLGGKYGHTIITGDIEHSELIKRIESSIDSKKHMPPATMPQLKPIEVYLLKEWIKNGAKMGKSELHENLIPVVSAYLGINNHSKKETALPAVKPVDTAVYTSIKKNIGIIHPITEGSNLLDISLVHFRNKSKAEILTAFNQLKPISENIYWLDLSGLDLESNDLEILTSMKNLNKLNLSNTKVDEGVKMYLKKLINLEKVNYYGTGVK